MIELNEHVVEPGAGGLIIATKYPDSLTKGGLCKIPHRQPVARSPTHPHHEPGKPVVGAPRIHGELLKLGIEVGQTSVGKYMVRLASLPLRHGVPSSTNTSRPWCRPIFPRSNDSLSDPLRVPALAHNAAYVERVIGTIRRECLDHTIVFGEAPLGRTLRSHVDSCHGSNLSPSKYAPDPRPMHPTKPGHLIAIPQVGGASPR